MANNDGNRRLPIMVRPSRKTQKPFWPFMDLWGLHRKAIEADGNCLFRALSDQMYDTTERHGEIRQKVVTYLRDNRESFEPFVPLDPEDLVRSQPSTRSSRSWRVSVDDPYEAYLQNMAKPKTWGGEIEITAFCEAYNKDVIIHRPTDAGQPFDQKKNNKRAAGQSREFVHVSFGGESNHPHYESVQPINAVKPPAPPAQSPRPTTRRSLCAGADKPLPLSDYNKEPLSVIQQARPTISTDELHTFLEKSRNQMDTIFSQVINTDRERSSSASSASQRSSSSKRSREDDDDEEESDRASKRALRRISLRNKTSAFVTSIAPPSSLHGTEICFKIRIDTPPGTPIESLALNKGVTEEGKEAEGEKPDQQGSQSTEGEEKKVPNTTGKSSTEEVQDRPASSEKAQSGECAKETRAESS